MSLALKRQDQYVSSKHFTVYVYHLSTGLTIRSNGEFQFDNDGDAILNHCGEINNRFVEYISFKSSAIIAHWIE